MKKFIWRWAGSCTCKWWRTCKRCLGGALKWIYWSMIPQTERCMRTRQSFVEKQCQEWRFDLLPSFTFAPFLYLSCLLRAVSLFNWVWNTKTFFSCPWRTWGSFMCSLFLACSCALRSHITPLTRSILLNCFTRLCLNHPTTLNRYFYKAVQEHIT